jgi:hypothetical protein
LTEISTLISKEECDKHVFEEIFALIDDEEIEVKIAALEAFSQISKNFSDDLKETKCVPMLETLFNSEEQVFQELFMQKLGQIMTNVGRFRLLLDWH